MRGWTGGGSPGVGGLEPGVGGLEVKRKIEKSKKIKRGEGIRRLVPLPFPQLRIGTCIHFLKIKSAIKI